MYTRPRRTVEVELIGGPLCGMPLELLPSRLTPELTWSRRRTDGTLSIAVYQRSFDDPHEYHFVRWGEE